MNAYKVALATATISIFIASCSGVKHVTHNFSEETHPEAPNYADTSYWAALPTKNDYADLVPIETLKDEQAAAEVDVFWVHPTTLYGKKEWNASLDDEKLNKDTDEKPIMHQASIFNGSCRIYAPRYRQANYCSFFDTTASCAMALDFAYQDVKTAFEYYLENYNEGRPFIIAGHSQGSFHNIRLVKEMIDKTDLKDQMVAAYLVGMPVFENYFEELTPCNSADETGCYVSWNTFKTGNYGDMYDSHFKGSITTNPLTWATNDTTYTSEQNHTGGVGPKYNKVFTQLYGAQAIDGLLWVDPVDVPGIPFTKLVKNWHIGDYNLFWMDVRENIEDRIENYLNKKDVSSN